MGTIAERLQKWAGIPIVIDAVSPYVAIGILIDVGEDYLELANADMHDLRDSSTTRENYLAQTARIGVHATRRKLIVRMAEVVAISKLEDLC